MRAYYNTKTETLTMIPENERVNIRFRFLESMTRDERNNAKSLFMEQVIKNPAIAFLHPSCRRRGKAYGYASTGGLGTTLLPSDFVDMGVCLVVAVIKLGKKVQETTGESVNTNSFNSAIRRGLIDEMLPTL